MDARTVAKIVDRAHRHFKDDPEIWAKFEVAYTKGRGPEVRRHLAEQIFFLWGGPAVSFDLGAVHAGLDITPKLYCRTVSLIWLAIAELVNEGEIVDAVTNHVSEITENVGNLFAVADTLLPIIAPFKR